MKVGIDLEMKAEMDIRMDAQKGIAMKAEMDIETNVEMGTEMDCKKVIEVSVEIDTVNGPFWKVSIWEITYTSIKYV
jgi:hypothetical protein